MSWKEILKIKKMNELIFREFSDFIDEQVMQYPSSKIHIYIRPDNEMNDRWTSTMNYDKSGTENGRKILVSADILEKIQPAFGMGVLIRIGNEYKNNGYRPEETTLDGYKGIIMSRKTDHPTLSEYGGAGRIMNVEGK